MFKLLHYAHTIKFRFSVYVTNNRAMYWQFTLIFIIFVLMFQLKRVEVVVFTRFSVGTHLSRWVSFWVVAGGGR